MRPSFPIKKNVKLRDPVVQPSQPELGWSSCRSCGIRSLGFRRMPIRSAREECESRIVVMYLEAANCSAPLSQPSRLIRGGTSSTRCSASTKEQRHVQSTLRRPVSAAILCHGQPIDMNQCTEDVFRSVWAFQHESRSFTQLLSLARMLSPVASNASRQLRQEQGNMVNKQRIPTPLASTQSRANHVSFAPCTYHAHIPKYPFVPHEVDLH